jgi:hypothetical protein
MRGWSSKLVAVGAGWPAVLAVVAGCSSGAPVQGWGDEAGPGDAGSAAASSSSGIGGMSSGARGSNGSSSGGGNSNSGSSPSSGGTTGSSSGGSSGASGGAGRDASSDATGSVDSSAGREAGGVDAGLPPSADGADPVAAARALCVQIINQDRASLTPPSPPLTEATSQESCVDGEAQADYQANKAHSAFPSCGETEQDECPNWNGTPSAIMNGCLAQMWAEGPPAAGQYNHYSNMASTMVTKVACGFYQTPSGRWWATQDFW